MTLRLHELPYCRWATVLRPSSRSRGRVAIAAGLAIYGRSCDIGCARGGRARRRKVSFDDRLSSILTASPLSPRERRPPRIGSTFSTPPGSHRVRDSLHRMLLCRPGRMGPYLGIRQFLEPRSCGRNRPVVGGHRDVRGADGHRRRARNTARKALDREACAGGAASP